uniref:Cystine knot toxin n=1 Tax=Chilobrachys guangxiensis TaxID=278060 RepID=B1P1D1_CHIGU|nr:cystine knot toxin [Chilobrachys guangxiensis]
MKTTILVVILGLTLLFALSAATELKDEERDCKGFQVKCKKDSECCSSYVCGSQWKWCVYPSPFGR